MKYLCWTCILDVHQYFPFWKILKYLQTYAGVGSANHATLALHGTLIHCKLFWSWCRHSCATHSLKQRRLIPGNFITPTGPHFIFDSSSALQDRTVCIRKPTRGFCKKPKFRSLEESQWAHVVCSVVGRDEGINCCCMRSRGSLICLSSIFLAERKLDRKPSELFNLPCIHHLQASHHSFLQIGWSRTKQGIMFFPFLHPIVDKRPYSKAIWSCIDILWIWQTAVSLPTVFIHMMYC